MMGRSRIWGHLMLTAVCLAPFTTASSLLLFERASTCPDLSYNQCSGTGLPSDFCCPSGSTCYALAANTTVLCCPSPGDCSSIKPITCDIQFQNITAHPDNTLKTTALTGTLPQCGTQCCPFGYTCNSAGLCILNMNQSVPPATSSSSVSIPGPTASTSGTLTVVPTSTSTSAPSETTSTSPVPAITSCNKYPINAILIGLFPGLLLGILLTSATVCVLGCRRPKNDRRKSGSSFGNISEPHLISSEIRTDFLRKPPQTPSTQGTTPSRRNTLGRVRSLFQKSANAGEFNPSQTPVPPMPLNIRKPMMQERPVTPIAQRDPSFEDIDIYADGGTASALRERERDNALRPKLALDTRFSRQTTFSDMMHKATKDNNLAGLPKGQPYVYKGSR